MKAYIGIDVGKKGGIVAIVRDSNKTVAVETAKTPLVNNEIDLHQVKEIILKIAEANNSSDIIIGIEAVTTVAGSGASSNFQFGRALGLIEGVCSGMEIPFVKIHAKKWQKVFFEGIPVTYKPAVKKDKAGNKKDVEKVDTKAMALHAAKRLYPNVNLLATERSSVPHEGIVDSLGIAHYLTLNH